MADSRTKNAKRNMVSEFINKMISLLLPFLIRTVIIYELGAMFLGLNSLFSSILTVLSLAELGFSSAMVFSMYEPIAKGNDAEVCALLNLYRKIYRYIGSVIFIIGIIISFFLDKIIKGDVPADINIYYLYFIFLSGTCLSYFLFAYKESLLIAHQRTDIVNNVATITSIIINICQILSLLLIRNYYAFCIFIPISSILRNIIICKAVDKRYPQYKCVGTISNKKIIDIKKRVAGLFIYKICYVFRDSIDNIVVSAFLGIVVLAKFNNYFYIVSTIIGFMDVIKYSIPAGVGNSIVTESEAKNHNDFQKFQLLYMGMSSWATVCLCCLITPFIRLWIGEEYLFPQMTVYMFCALFYCYKMGDMCAVYRQAAGLWWQDKHRPIVEAIVNVVLNLILVQYWGVNGVIASTVFCLIFINSIWASHTLYKHYFNSFSQWIYVKRIWFYGAITFITTCVVNQICQFIVLDNILKLIVNGLVCIIVPIPILLILLRMLPEYRDAIKLAKLLIMKKK